MKGIFKVFILAAAVLMAAGGPVSALDSLNNALAVEEKTLSPGWQVVSFEGVDYRVYTPGTYTLVFSRVDEEHNRVFIIPGDSEPILCQSIYMQWGFFPPVRLDLGLGGGTSYLLGTETGYAEK